MIILTFDNLYDIHVLKICRLLHCVFCIPNFKSMNQTNVLSEKKNLTRFIHYVQLTFELW